MTINLDIDALRSLVAVADTMSFSQAGRQVGRSQSAISNQISRLEHVLGRPCLRRTQGRVLGLTRDGDILIRYARRILRLNDEAYSAIVLPEISGTIRLGVPADFLDRGIPKLLEAFVARYGLVQLEVRSDLSRQLYEAAQHGALDLAFFKKDVGAHLGDSILREPLHWAAGREFELADSLAERVLPLVLFLEGCVYRRQAISVLEQAGIGWRLAFESASFSALRAAVASGIGISALPLGLIASPLKSLDSRCGLPQLAETEVAVVFAPARHNPTAKRLASFIMANMQAASRRSLFSAEAAL